MTGAEQQAQRTPVGNDELAPLEIALRKRLSAPATFRRHDDAERVIALTALRLVLTLRTERARLHIATCNDVPCLLCDSARQVLK